jgi:hypothetical protein
MEAAPCWAKPKARFLFEPAQDIFVKHRPILSAAPEKASRIAERHLRRNAPSS